MPLQKKISDASTRYVTTTFRSLRHWNYRLFFFGQLISLIGTWLQNTALGWLVYSMTHDARTLGIMSFIGSAPILFLSIIAGTVADEYSKRKILIMTQAMSGLLAVALAVALWTDTISIPVIAVINLMLGIVTAFDLPTRQAFVVEMTSKEDVSNAVALNSAVFNAARLIGPALGAIIIASFSVAMCFFLNGISYVAVIIGLLMMRFATSAHPRRKRTTSRMRSMQEGIVYLYRIPNLRALMLLVVTMTLFGWSYTVNLPVVAAKLLNGGASTFGALLSANGVGALIAALTQAAGSGKFDGRKMLFIGIGVFVLSLVGVALVHTLAFTLLCLVGTGWGIITFFITANTTLQRRVPDELRGRVMGIYSLSFAGLFPFGSLLSGFVAHEVGVSNAFLFNAVIVTLISIPVYFFVRKLPRLFGEPTLALAPTIKS
jgi:MFS family permease